MEFATLNNGASVPLIGLGTWKASPDEVGEVVKRAIEVGYRHIDCAHAYGNEADIGEALEECLDQNLVKREDLFVTSKLWNEFHRAEDVLPALKTTLKNLRLDYIDMYLMHWPVALKKDGGFPKNVTSASFLSLDEAPISKTWSAMEECVSAGLCRGIGVSNFSVKKMRQLRQKAKIIPAINQVERHPYLQQNALLAYCKEQGIHVTGYSPLGSMDRPARLREENQSILLDDPVILDVAARNDMAAAQVLLTWAIQSGTSVAAKTVQPKRLEENLRSGALKLDSADMSRIATLDKHQRYVSGKFWCPDGSPYTIENLWDEG